MTIDQLTSNLDDFLDFMKSRGYPVFHHSNLFLRDFQYGVRDYFRTTTKKDIGSRMADKYARSLVEYMESQGLMMPFSPNTWTLEMEKYLLEPVGEEAAEEQAEASA